MRKAQHLEESLKILFLVTRQSHCIYRPPNMWVVGDICIFDGEKLYIWYIPIYLHPEKGMEKQAHLISKCLHLPIFYQSSSFHSIARGHAQQLFHDGFVSRLGHDNNCWIFAVSSPSLQPLQWWCLPFPCSLVLVMSLKLSGGSHRSHW